MTTVVKVFTDPRYQPPIRSRCHPASPVECWPTASGRGLRVECKHCGMLVINYKIKSPIIRIQKPKKGKASP